MKKNASNLTYRCIAGNPVERHTKFRWPVSIC